MEVKLNSEEALILRQLLSQIGIKRRTGEIGIIHGADRFISTNFVLKKKDMELLDRAVAKMGLRSGLIQVDK